MSTVEVIADSIGPNGKRITTLLTIHPRIIHAELLRHRMLSFSVASSRAIPAEKILEQVKNDPFVPIRFQRSHRGMQGSEFLSFLKDTVRPEWTHEDEVKEWLRERDYIVKREEARISRGISKQIVNRGLEKFVYTRCVITATEWDGFFRLRNPWHYEAGGMFVKEGATEPPIVWEDKPNLNFPAEIHIQDLAIKMKKAMDASKPEQLKAGEWHIPFISDEDNDAIYKISYDQGGMDDPADGLLEEDIMAIKLSASRCAMTSYNTNKGRSIEQELDLANRLLKESHFSPFEHQAMAIPEFTDPCYSGPESWPMGLERRTNARSHYHEFWSRNFQNWVQARALLDS